jgi:hypothetical protein
LFAIPGFTLLTFHMKEIRLMWISKDMMWRDATVVHLQERSISTRFGVIQTHQCQAISYLRVMWTHTWGRVASSEYHIEYQCLQCRHRCTHVASDKAFMPRSQIINSTTT